MYWSELAFYQDQENYHNLTQSRFFLIVKGVLNDTVSTKLQLYTVDISTVYVMDLDCDYLSVWFFCYFQVVVGILMHILTVYKSIITCF